MKRRKKKISITAFIPTEEQIADACKLIQATWSTKERQRRRVRKEEETPWTAPEIATRELRWRA